MDNILVSWIGGNDLAANLKEDSKSGSHGPLLSTLLSTAFTKAFLLYNYPKDLITPYIETLENSSASWIKSLPLSVNIAVRRV